MNPVATSQVIVLFSQRCHNGEPGGSCFDIPLVVQECQTQNWSMMLIYSVAYICELGQSEAKCKHNECTKTSVYGIACEAATF